MTESLKRTPESPVENDSIKSRKESEENEGKENQKTNDEEENESLRDYLQNIELIKELLPMAVSKKKEISSLVSQLPNFLDGIIIHTKDATADFTKAVTETVSLVKGISQYQSPILCRYLSFIAGAAIEMGGKVTEESGKDYVDVLESLVNLSWKHIRPEEVEGGDNKPGMERLFQDAFNSLTEMSPPSSHFLSHTKAVRDYLRQKTTVLEKMDRLRWHTSGLKMLHKLFSLLDNEEIIVIHPLEKKGFVVHCSGVSDNHQLHTILAGLLCSSPSHKGAKEAEESELYLSGSPPSQEIIHVMCDSEAPQTLDQNVAGVWDMRHWYTYGTKSSIFEDPDKSFIWGEGVPRDISFFKGKRVILLYPPSYNRFWGCTRIFAPLRAEVEVTHRMTDKEVESYLQDIQNATEKEVKEAEEFVEVSFSR